MSNKALVVDVPAPKSNKAFKGGLFTTAFFLIILCLPSLFQSLDIKVRVRNSENRQLAPLPDFSLEQTRSGTGLIDILRGFYRDTKIYKDNYNQYYQDNFVLKDLLFDLYNVIQVDFFSKSPLPDKVVLGENGWFFLGDSYSDVIVESKGLINFSAEDLFTIKRNLLNRKAWLSDRGIDYYVAIAPNKHTAYGEFLPIRKANRATKWEQLKGTITSNELCLIDLSMFYDQFPETRLFHKTDSHWNDLGAFLGYKALISRVNERHPEVSSLSLNDFTSHTEVVNQLDLTKMLSIEKAEERIILKNKRPVARELAPRFPVPIGAFVGPKEYEKRYKSNVNNLKVLVFRDSFGSAMTQFIKESFGESIIVWDHSFNKQIIEQEKPDIVIHLIVERSLDELSRE